MSKKIIDILCIGHACYDIIFTVKHHPGANEKMLAEQAYNFGGARSQCRRHGFLLGWHFCLRRIPGKGYLRRSPSSGTAGISYVTEEIPAHGPE